MNKGDLIAFDDTARVLRGENMSHIYEVKEFIENPGSERGHYARACPLYWFDGRKGCRELRSTWHTAMGCFRRNTLS